MELTALLLLPLVGGYIFANNCNATRFKAAREEGHRLYFRAAYYGVFLFLIVTIARLLVVWLWPEYREWERTVLPTIQPMLKDSKEDSAVVVLLALCAMLLGGISGPILNATVFGESRWLKAAIKEDEFEALLHRALARAMPIALTMENRKVYVGFVSKTFEPKMSRKNFRILPLMSGYRTDTGKMIFTTFYDEAYARAGVVNGSNSRLTLEDFEILFPTDKVHSAGLFDVPTYTEFQRIGGAPVTVDPESQRKAWAAHIPRQ